MKIVVATDLSRLPENVRQDIDAALDRLAYEQKATIVRPPSATVALKQALFDDCDIVVTRPTGGLWTKIRPSYFENNHHSKVHIFTVSAGRDSLKAFKNSPKFEIDAPDVANSAGVAACTVMMASELLFRSNLGGANVRRGRFSAARACTSLVGKTWAIYGSGRQVTELVDLLHVTGVKRIIIFNDKFEEKNFRECVSIIDGKYERVPDTGIGLYGPEQSFSRCVRYKRIRLDQHGKEIDSPPHELEIVSRLSKERSFGGADVISIHIPHKMEEERGHPPTHRVIGGPFLSMLRNKPILLNMSRGEVLDESDVLEALARGDLSGVGVDVLDSEVEYSNDVSKSPLWEALRKQEQDSAGGSVDPNQELNLIITPHIAGSVDTDVKPMWEDVIRKIRAIVEKD